MKSTSQSQANPVWMILMLLLITPLTISFAQAPGGVSDGLLMWHKADDGVTTPGSKDIWQDVSGNGRDVVQPNNPLYEPTLVTRADTLAENNKKYFFNFNPFYYFDGTDDFFYRVGDAYFDSTSSAGSAYGVMFNSNAGGWRTPYGWADDDPNLVRFGQEYQFWRQSGLAFATMNAQLQEKPAHIGSMLWRSSGNDGLYINLNGQIYVDSTTGIGTLNNQGTDPNSFAIGSESWGLSGDGNEVFQGGIPEVFAYSVDHRNSTGDELQRINSYLAIKYGITLSSADGTGVPSYLSSNSTVVWDSTANVTNHHNVFGIGHDLASDLQQKQSRSANPGQQLIIGHGSELFDNNAANANDLADGQFLLVGDNGLPQSLSTPLVYSGGSNGTANFRFGAIWKAQTTNLAGDITVAWPVGVENLYFVQSADSIFDSSDSFTPMTTVDTINGVAYNVATVNAGNGYFTFAGFSYAPGGVIAAAWYRSDIPANVFSDAGVTNAADGEQVQQWEEFLGKGYDLTQSTMAYRPVFSDSTTLANFNPTVTFNGNNEMVYQPGPDTNIIDRADGTLYAAGYFNVLGAAGILGFDYSADYPGLHTSTGSNESLLFFTGGPGYQGNSAPGLADNTYFIGGANWKNDGGSSAGYASSAITLNGFDILYTGTELQNVVINDASRDIILGGDGNWGDINGQMNEGIIFEHALDSNEMDRVDSYLAIKFGITLADGKKNYLSANNTVVWDTLINAGNAHNIFGIGRDDVSCLYQKQSRSANAGQKLIIGNGNSLSNTNLGNPNDFVSDMQFLMVGDNGLRQALDTTLVYTGGSNGPVSFRFGAIWKAQNTFMAGDVTVAWPVGIDNLYFVQSADSTFDSSDRFTPMAAVDTINGVAYNIATVTIGNGEYFTLAGFTYAPGGVVASAWYRSDIPVNLFSDAGTTNAADLDQVQQWDEFLGTGYDLSQSTMAFRPVFSDSTTLVNFNPTMTFNGNNEMIYQPGPDTNIIDRENGTLYAAGYFNNLGAAGIFAFDGSGDYPGLHTSQAPYESILFYTAGSPYTAVSEPGLADNAYFIGGANWQNDGGSTGHASSVVTLNGLKSLYNGTEINNVNPSLTTRDIILGGDSNWGDVNGQVNEGIIFEYALDSNEMDRVDSYLAIKFGNTLADGKKNYLSSNSTVVWDSLINAGNANNIFGIGRDDVSCLFQHQSRSTNEDQKLIIGHGGSLFNTNLGNTNEFSSDMQFLMVGDNGLRQALDTTLVYTGGSNGETNFRFGAIWKAQNTGGVGSVTVAWPVGIENLYFVQSADSTFDSSDSFTPMTTVDSINGVAYNIATVTIGNGQYFTFAGYACGPGGVVAGLLMWHRADDGVVTPGPKDIWQDVSGNGRDVVQPNNPLYEPILVTRADTLAADNKNYFFNFNPFYYFDGTNDFFYRVDDAYFDSLSSAGSAYGVMFNSNAGGWRTPYGWADDDPNLVRVGQEYQFWRENGLASSTTNAQLQVKPAHIGSIIWRSSSYNGLYINVNGAMHQDSTNGIGTVNNLGSFANSFAIGSEGFDLAGNGNEVFQGGISEVFAYSEDHQNSTGNEKLRINSYLAIKYGITLLTEAGTSTSNYLSSQSVVVWDTLVNAGYNNNVAGIASDMASCLSQNQSISENPGQQVLIGTLGLDSTNAMNADSLVEGQFLLWGDNGGARRPCVYIADAVGGQANVLFEAIWKVQNTNDVGTVRVAWPVQGNELSLVQSSDTIFDGSDTYTPMTDTITLNGVDYVYTDVTLTDGSYFTFGTTIEHAPGGVFENLSYWYRSDTGVTSAGVGMDITEWTDFAYGVPVHQLGMNDLPELQSGAEDYLNFHRGVNFTATNQTLGNLEIETLGSREFDIFTFTQKDVAGTRFFNVGVDNTTFNGGNWDSPGLYDNGTIWRRDSTFTTVYNGGVGSNFAGNLNNLKYYHFDNDSVNAALNGTDLLSMSIAHGPAGRAFGGHIFGANSGFTGGDDAGITGSVGETIVYGCGQVTAEQRRRIESYLAVKYGMTLDRVDTLPYLSSAGDTTWLGSLNPNFNNNIFGIGRDDITALDQRVSKSANEELTDIILTIGTNDDFVSENQDPSRTPIAEDESFFLIGDDNNTSTAPLVDLSLPFIGDRIQRRWYSQRTGNTGEIFFRADFTAYGFAATDTISMIIADDSLFTENVTVVEGTFDGTYWEYSHDFDGDLANRYFTFGRIEGLLLPFGCTTDLYVSEGDSTQLNIADYTVDPLVLNPVGTPVTPGQRYNSLGLNPVDGYLYAVVGTSPPTAFMNHLLAIGQNGEFVDLGLISGLPNNPGSVASSGEIDDNGIYYITFNGDNNLYSVDLNTGSPYTASVLTTNALFGSTSDLAYNVNDDLLYGVTNLSGQTYAIDPILGTVTLVGPPNYPANDGPNFGGAVGGDGQIYVIATSGGIYAVDVMTGELVLAGNTPVTTSLDAAHCVTSPLDIRLAMCLPSTEFVTAPNCSSFSPSITGDGQIVFGASDVLSNHTTAQYPITVSFLNQWGGVIGVFELVDFCDPDTMFVCENLGQVVQFSVTNGLGTCDLGQMILNGVPGVVLTSGLGTQVTGPNVSNGKINVYCGNEVSTSGNYVPAASAPCGGSATVPVAQPDWIMPFPCNEESDTAEVIFRTWESYDKEGNLSTITDTIVVFRLPRLTPGAFIGSAEDSFYCELEGVPNAGEALKRYVSWKQPVGLHDYERPYTKLRGLTYEIPATIIIAGLTNAYAQGPDVYDDYLDCVILRKLDGSVVTIRDIVTGAYATDLVAHATDEQKLYGVLQILIELNEKPINVVLETLLEFYPYLLLQEGDWVLSEGGNFEQVTADWFFNGNGNSPFWFAGGWPSIYGSGDCVSYCDTGSGEEFEDCIQIVVPLLDINGLNPQICDTICLPTGTHCGISIDKDELTDWTPTGSEEAGTCPQTRGLDTRITQTCWALTPNICASDVGEGGIVCGEPFVDNNPDDVVVDYSCTDKAVKIHISQWQTLFDTIGPIFDFCYPVTPVVLPPTLGNDIPNIEQIVQFLGYTLSQVYALLDSTWNHDAIQDSIRDGKQYPLAALWEMQNPTTYRVSSHDCEASIYVPSVKVVDNCSGLHSIKAMVDVPGGTRSVELIQTDVEIKIMPNRDTCYVYTYSHLTNPIRIPFNGCDGTVTPVRYEAADNCWNQSEWYKFITIVDDTPPTVVTDRDVNVTLNSKTEWVKAETFDEGSWDNCAIDLKLARRSDWINCIDICGDLGPNAEEGGYLTWEAILDDLGYAPSDIAAAANGSVAPLGVDDRFNINDLKVFLNNGEIEEYFYHQIVWLWEDGQNCGRKTVHGWLFAIAAYIADNCSILDEHQNGLDKRDLEVIFDNLYDEGGYGNEVSLIGGGWAQAVPFKCEDACEEVSAELLVYDYCCNWGIGWSDVLVEDKSNARLVKRLPDLAISCEAYNIFYKDLIESAAALNGEGGSAADTTGLFAELDSALGGYIKTWVDNQNRPTDIDGNLLPADSLVFDYWNVTCEEESEVEKVSVPLHDGGIGWETVVNKTTYLDTATLEGMHGIIGVNCAATCVQDVWIDLDECGQGTITRRFTISSGCTDNAPEWEVEQVITIESACGMRQSMFDLPANVGTKDAPVCLPQGLSVETQDLASLPDTIGKLTLKDHLVGKLCNSFAVGSTIKEYQVQGVEGMVKYEIEWSVIDWCAPHTSTNREFTYTQEVIATIDENCDVSGPVDTTGTDTTDVSLVAGVILTEKGEAVQAVEMKAVLGSGSPLTTLTGGEGTYNFSISNGSEVSLVPGKNTGFANGVSTQDLIDIQRHVLQKNALDSKYQKIAADVNGNGNIDGLDVLELRKLVMKPDSRFSNNTSWRFFDTQTDKESYDVSNLNGDVTVDWIGVKIGDVNLSGDPARGSTRHADGNRSTTGELHLNVADKTLKAGELYRVDVTSDNFVNINGMQYTLSYLTNMVEVESIEAGALNVTKDNYLHYAPGVITSSWSEADGQSLSSDAVLFTIVLKAKSAVKLRDVLSLNNRVTVSEAYDAEGGLKDVSLRFDGQESGFALYQNTPNPYAGETVIGFKLPVASKATLSVYDVTGKVLKVVEGEYNQGYNEVRLTATDLGVTGVLYYQLDTDRYTATKKMVVVE